MSLHRHLAEDRLRDVVVAAPVGRALCEGELVEEVSVALGREPVRLVVHGRRVVDQVTRRSLRLDQRDLLGAGGGRHDGDERQAEEAREVRLGHGGRAGGRLDDRRPFGDPAVAQAVEEQRACESMLQRSRRVHRLVLEVEVDVPVPRATERHADACRPTDWHRLRCDGRPRPPTLSNRRVPGRCGTWSRAQSPRSRQVTAARRPTYPEGLPGLHNWGLTPICAARSQRRAHGRELHPPGRGDCLRER